MADDNVGLVRRAYEAFGRGDIPAVMEAFTHDIEWNVPAVLPHGTRARGPEEVGQVFQGIATTWEGFGVELDDLVGAGDRVFAIGRAHGRLEGRETGYGFVHCWSVRDGALARLDEYVDPDPEVYGG